VLEETNRRRVPELVAIREARMWASPFAFLRGAPAVMAADLATTPATGIPVQACGDAHLLNFGLFATPERNLVFGLNDFDETLPGPWEWDVKRLATSFVVAARTVGFDQAQGRRAALAAVRTYREQLARYRASLPEARRQLLGRFRAHDAARKVVGVGSVGTRCYVVLLLGDRDDDPLLLQIKQATASVLEPYAGRSRHRHHGRRVVNGQRLLQTASDIFLGWTGDGVAQDYVRQLWDMKGSVNIEAMPPDHLFHYGRLCGWVLARAHARSGDAVAISGYLGSSDRFDRAVASFAEAHADQSEADYAAFRRARGSPAGDGGRGGSANQRKGAEG
jgi:uncharacterized protein (DUF2252 family)